MENVQNKPLFPMLGIDNDDYLLIIEDKEMLTRCSAYFFLKRSKYRSRCFDGNGVEWEYVLNPVSYKSTFLNKILAKTFFNPSISVVHVFTEKGKYEIEVLKGLLKKCVDADGDVITQFADAYVINRAIDKASDFNEILAVFEKYMFNPDEEEIWKEHEERGIPE